MARETIYVVQPFDYGARGKLVPGTPIPARNEVDARDRAQRMAGKHVGVVAFSRTGDADLGDYDDAVILAKHGSVPLGIE